MPEGVLLLMFFLSFIRILKYILFFPVTELRPLHNFLNTAKAAQANILIIQAAVSNTGGWYRHNL